MLSRSARRLPQLPNAQCLRHPRAIRYRTPTQWPSKIYRPILGTRLESTGTSTRKAAPSRYAAPADTPKWVLFKEAMRKHPYQGGLGIFVVLSGVVMLIYANYVYITYFQRINHKYPPTVAKPMKRALYYTNYSVDPKLALKYYKEALFAAREAAMDPFSPEVLGIKIQVAAFLEKMHQYDQSIQVLESVRKDCLEWVYKEGGGDRHFRDGQRTIVLAASVGMGVKLGQLYCLDWVGRIDDAEEALVSAAETVLKEKKRREVEGVQEGEGEWMSEEEVGGSLEALGQLYSSKDEHALAAPLYLQALSLCPPKSCHAVILMNNVASAIAQQPPPANPVPNFPSLPEQAALWAKKAIAVSETIPASDRTDECTTGCATAKANLAELAERAGRLDEAARLFGEAEELSKEVNFDEGVNQASVGRRRVVQLLRNGTNS